MKKKPRNDLPVLLDPALEKYYSLGKERKRLKEAPLEKDRMLRILKKEMPPAPAEILDVGGAHGVYAFPLAEQGYKVHLIDPIPLHIEQARKYAKKNPSAKLASYSVGDARKIEHPDNSVDVILFFGPLYHLVSVNERLKALSEAFRVLKKGGLLLATGISRFQSFIDNMHKNLFLIKNKTIKHDLITGQHFSKNSKLYLYFHCPQELKNELLLSGFKSVTILGIEGPVWCQNVLKKMQNDKKAWRKLLDTLEIIEEEEAIVGSSAHIMAIGKKI